MSHRIPIRTSEEILLMREAGRLLARTLTALGNEVRPGVSTMSLARFAEDYITGLKARPASIGQYGYPYALNASLNHVVCHGFPRTTDILKDGDLINLDVTLEKNGFIVDSSCTFILDDTTSKAHHLSQVSYECLWRAIAKVRPGARLGDIGHTIQTHAHLHGYSVVREFCGHGIGRQMHEPPEVLHFGKAGTGITLKPGMTFTIEPMLNAGSRHIRNMPDGWTVQTRDGQLSAQWEHTLLVTEDSFEVLTLRDEEIPWLEAALGGTLCELETSHRNQ